jgi:hypothetical protein
MTARRLTRLGKKQKHLGKRRYVDQTDQVRLFRFSPGAAPRFAFSTLAPMRHAAMAGAWS